MTVKELIEALQKFPEDAGVFVLGHGNEVVPVVDVYENTITETDYKKSIILD